MCVLYIISTLLALGDQLCHDTLSKNEKKSRKSKLHFSFLESTLQQIFIFSEHHVIVMTQTLGNAMNSYSK